jgi:hypothetical protein
MSDPVSLAPLFDAAEQAARSGDFAAAARLLGEAARAQEAALGPDHFNLANTLNNLAVAHERSGQLDAAEREYRRAHAIAARTRPADDPLVTTSAQNLREFCEAHGRPVDVPPSAMSLADDTTDPITTPVIARPQGPVDAPTRPVAPLAITFADPAPARPRPEPVSAAPPRPAAAQVKPVTAPTPRRAPAAPAATAAPVPAADAEAPRRRVSIPVLVAIGAVAALVIWLLAGRGPATSSGDATAAASDTPPSGTPADAGSAPPAAAPAAPAPKAPPTPAAPATVPPPASAPASAGGVTIGDAQICRSLSPSYRCDAAGPTVRPGRLVFYTRLIADRNTSVVHRWYRGDELRQSMRLDVPARRQGFRTFSRATVSASEGEWRVELRTRDGQLLHTERFTVR